jgi:hypothetical protein
MPKIITRTGSTFAIVQLELKEDSEKPRSTKEPLAALLFHQILSGAIHLAQAIHPRAPQHLELLHQLHLLSVNRLGWDNNQVYSVEAQLSKVQASLGSHQAWGTD